MARPGMAVSASSCSRPSEIAARSICGVSFSRSAMGRKRPAGSHSPCSSSIRRSGHSRWMSRPARSPTGKEISRTQLLIEGVPNQMRPLARRSWALPRRRRNGLRRWHCRPRFSAAASAASICASTAPTSSAVREMADADARRRRLRRRRTRFRRSMLCQQRFRERARIAHAGQQQGVVGAVEACGDAFRVLGGDLADDGADTLEQVVGGRRGRADG